MLPHELENDPQQIRAVADATEIAKASEKRERDFGLDGAQSGGRLLLPVEGDRDGGAESDSLHAGEVGGGAAAEGLESSEVGGVEGSGRGEEEDNALGSAAVNGLGAVQGSLAAVIEDGEGGRVLAEDHLGEGKVETVAREIMQRGPSAVVAEAHQGSRAAALSASLDDQQEERGGLLARREPASEQMKHSPVVFTSVRQLHSGVVTGEGQQVGDGGGESGDSLRQAAIPRRPEEVEESGVEHETCKRERAVEHGEEEGASEGTDGAWRKARA